MLFSWSYVHFLRTAGIAQGGVISIRNISNPITISLVQMTALKLPIPHEARSLHILFCNNACTGKVCRWIAIFHKSKDIALFLCREVSVHQPWLAAYVNNKSLQGKQPKPNRAGKFCVGLSILFYFGEYFFSVTDHRHRLRTWFTKNIQFLLTLLHTVFYYSRPTSDFHHRFTVGSSTVFNFFPP